MDSRHVSKDDLGNGAVLRTIDLAALISERTGTRADGWEGVDGPESGVGVDYWYYHEANDWTAYVVVDQDDISISIADAGGSMVDELNESA